MLELLVQLIEHFEENAYPIPEAPGYRVLRTLMENRGVKQADLLPIFGSRGIASEVYNGNRAISLIRNSRYEHWRGTGKTGKAFFHTAAPFVCA